MNTAEDGQKGKHLRRNLTQSNRNHFPGDQLLKYPVPNQSTMKAGLRLLSRALPPLHRTLNTMYAEAKNLGFGVKQTAVGSGSAIYEL